MWVYNGQPVYNDIKIGFIMVSQCNYGIKCGFIMVSQCILWHQTWVYNGQQVYIMASNVGLKWSASVYYGIKRGFIMVSQCIMASNVGL